MLTIKQQKNLLQIITFIFLLGYSIEFLPSVLAYTYYIEPSSGIDGEVKYTLIELKTPQALFKATPHFGYFPVSHEYYVHLEQELKKKEKAEKYRNDPRVKRVRALYHQYGSPLESKAEFMVETSDYFGIDYRLVPAISIVESGGGVKTYRPYNAWGWGGQGNAFVFHSWEEAIITVTKGLKEYYWDNGARTPYQIGPYYNPESWQSWAAKVSYIMSQL